MIPFLAQSLVEISWGHLKQVRPNKELCLETVLFHKYEEPIQKYNNTTQTKKLKDNNWGIALCVYLHCKVSIGQYTKMCTSPLIFFSSIISDDKYLRKIFDHFHFHCIFDHLSHEQS